MKKTIQIIILLWSSSLMSQTIVKIEPDDEKNKYISCYLLDENDMMLTLSFKDKNGFYDLRNIKTDSLKTYRLYLDDSRFMKIDREINLKKSDTLIIKLKPSKNCDCKTYPKNVFVKKCTFYDFGTYIGKSYRNIDELPLIVIKKAKKYLLSNVGKKFYKNIYFKKAQVLDSVSYNKSLKYNKMKNHLHYYLCFGFSNLSKGIGEYTFNIECDEFGNIINDMKLPKKNLDVNKLVSLKEIINSIENNNLYDKEKSNINFDYYFEKNIFVWKLKNCEYLPKNELICKESIFNAHNGKFIEIKIYKGTWD